MAKILRDSLFINSILLNSEVWYNLSKSNIEELEKLDNILLRKFLQVGNSVPTAMLHLELGTLPIRFILTTRRLMFLHYILQEDEESLLFSFLLAQMEDPNDGDWWLTVKNEMEELKLDVTLSEVGKSVPTAMLNLELGTLPIRFILTTRRLMFLHYILQEDEESLLYSFLLAQMEDP